MASRCINIGDTIYSFGVRIYPLAIAQSSALNTALLSICCFGTSCAPSCLIILVVSSLQMLCAASAMLIMNPASLFPHTCTVGICTFCSNTPGYMTLGTSFSCPFRNTSILMGGSNEALAAAATIVRFRMLTKSCSAVVQEADLSGSRLGFVMSYSTSRNCEMMASPRVGSVLQGMTDEKRTENLTAMVSEAVCCW